MYPDDGNRLLRIESHDDSLYPSLSAIKMPRGIWLNALELQLVNGASLLEGSGWEIFS